MRRLVSAIPTLASADQTQTHCPNTPCTSDVTFDEACRVVRPERFPPLVPCHLRQRTIAAQRRGIVPLQPAQEKSRRRQRVWKDLAHDGGVSCVFMLRYLPAHKYHAKTTSVRLASASRHKERRL